MSVHVVRRLAVSAVLGGALCAGASGQGALTPEAPLGTLVAIARLDADTFRPGPASGRFRDNGVRGEAFTGQPVQGVSAIMPAPGRPDWWLALSDNGFGVRWNSPDYVLCVYALRPHWRSRAGGSGHVEVGDAVQLADPRRLVPFALTREDTTERWLTGADFDPEAFVRRDDGTFWIGEEFGPFLLHVDGDGRVAAAPVAPEGLASSDRPGLPPPEAGQPGIARVRRSRGFEALADTGDGRTLLAMLEGPTLDDPPDVARILEFDAETGRFTGRSWPYRLDRPGHSVTELVRYAPDRYVAIERDGGHGPGAVFKRVFAVRLGEPGHDAEKALVLDLLRIADPDRLGGAPVFRFPFVTTEAVWVQGERTLVLANDNNYPATGGRTDGVRDGTEFIRVDLVRPLPR